MDITKIEEETKAIEDRITAVENKFKEKDQEKLNAVLKGQNQMTTENTKPQGASMGSDEQRALKFFGVGHVKDLIGVNTGDKRFAGVPAELKHLVLELKRDIDICRLTSQIVGGDALDRDEKPASVKGMLDSCYYAKHVLAPKLKAFGTGNAGEGAEWVPTAVSSQYIEEYELERVVARQFRQIMCPSNPFDLPVQSSTTKARIQAEGGGLAGSNFGTAKISFDATKLTEFYPLSEELNEDSAPAILGLARSEVVEAQIRAVEAAIINGDTTAPHMDFDTNAAAANVAEKAWKGLRKLALENSANGSLVGFGAAAVDLAGLRSMREAMGKFGVNPRELMWLTSTKTYNQFMGIAEVKTADVFGPMATILTGSLVNLDGIPVVISEYMRDDLAAGGVRTDAGPNTFASVLLVNKMRFYWGLRRPIRVKAVMDPTPPADQWLLCSWHRSDFKGHVQSASEVSVVLGHNIA